MRSVVYAIAALLLVALAFVVFRVVARRDYQRNGRLTPLSSTLQLLVWGLYMGFPSLYNPPEWVRFWSAAPPVPPPLRVIGVSCTVLGLVSAFGTVLWFGLRRALGLEVEGLMRTGPYRFTRNPQLVGGSLMVIGPALLWPSLYALGWVLLYGFVSHTMVLTEEEHLLQVYGEEYTRFCQRVSRYLGWPRRVWAGCRWF
jgi:protein-S-isoprenylcysteine O-methyltransferase Ste14